MVATLNDGQLTQNTDLSFLVTFGPDCRSDYVTFGNVITGITHYITSPPSIETFDPQFSTLTANCPVTCSLTQGSGPGFTSPAIVSFDPASGTFQLSEQDYFQDKTEMDMTLACTSTLSESAQSTTYNTFTVTLLDVCRTASISMPDINPTALTTYLWPIPVDQFSIQAVSSSLNCAPYAYSVILAPNVPAVV